MNWMITYPTKSINISIIISRVSHTVNNLAKMEHSIFQIESKLVKIEKRIVPNKQAPDILNTMYWNMLYGGSIPPHQPRKNDIGHPNNRAMSQPLAVKTISPRLDLTIAMI